MSRRKWLIGGALVGASAFGLEVAGPRVRKEIEKRDYATEHFNKRRKEFSDRPHQDTAVALVGDSRVERGRAWNFLNCGGHVENFGIGFDTTAGVRSRVEDVIRFKPRIVVLEIGINDFISNWHWPTDDEIVSNIREVVTDFRRVGSAVVINPILPTTKTYALEPSQHERIMGHERDVRRFAYSAHQRWLAASRSRFR